MCGIVGFINNHDSLTLLSDTENFGNVVIEAVSTPFLELG